MPRWLCSSLLALSAACGPRDVSIQMSLPDETGVAQAISGARVVVLPFDRDSILASLEAAATEPRPNTQVLDSLFQVFRGHFGTYNARRTEVDRLRAAGNDSAALTRAEAGLATAQAALERARREILPVTDTLRAEIRTWRERVYRSYDRLANSLIHAWARQPIIDTTRANGWMRVYLPDGDWWVHARAFDAGDPNSEWYWNLRVEGDTLRLDASTGRLRPRY